MASVKEIFLLCQKSTNFVPFLKMLKKLYSETVHADFSLEFFQLLKTVIAIQKREVSANRILNLTVKFASEMNNEYKGDGDEIAMHPFLRDLLLFLIKISNCAIYMIRVHVLRLMGRTLKELTELMCEETLLDKMYKLASERLKDICAHVRAEAVLAVCYLQDPGNPSCPIIDDFLFLLENDPYYGTRKNVAEVLAITRKTLPSLKKRLTDINPTVRKVALTRISEKVSIRCFSMLDRIHILQISCRDYSLKPVMKEKLLPSWIKECGGDIVKFLTTVDIPSAPEAIQEALNIVFAQEDLRTLGKKLNLDPNLHVIPKEHLNEESAFFWSSLCQYVKTQKSDLAIDMFDELTPTISDFCDYLESFLEVMKNSKEISYHFLTFEKLFVIAEEMDFTDTYGVKRFKALLKEILMSDICLLEMVDPLVKGLRASHSNQLEFFQKICEITSELAQPFMDGNRKLDERSLINLRRGLMVLCSAFKIRVLKDVPSQLIELKDMLLLPCLVFNVREIRQVAVEALGLYSLLGVEEARENYCYFMHALSDDAKGVQVAALRASFDILLYFGPSLVIGISRRDDAGESGSVLSTQEERELFIHFHENLIPLLDSEEYEIRTLTVKGMAKLLFWKRITSSSLFCRLFLMCYSETYKNDIEIRDFLTYFLPAYAASEALRPEHMEDAFIIALDTIFSAPSSSALSKIDGFLVGVALLQLARLIRSAYINKQGNIIHEDLAPKILEKILKNPDADYVCSLAKILNYLEISKYCADGIIAMIHKVLDNINHKIAIKHVQKFLCKVTSLTTSPCKIENEDKGLENIAEHRKSSVERDTPSAEEQVIAESSLNEATDNTEGSHCTTVLAVEPNEDTEIVIPESPSTENPCQEEDDTLLEDKESGLS